MDRALALASGDTGVFIDASVLNRRRSDFALQSENRQDARRFADAALTLSEQAVARSPSESTAREARVLAWFAQGRALLSADLDAALNRFGRVRTYFADATTRGAVPPREAALVEVYTAEVFFRRSDKVRAPQYARQGLRVANQILATRPNDQTAQLDVAFAEAQLASILYNSGDQDGSVAHFKAAAEMRERIVAADPDNVRARERLALAKGRLGTILARAGDYPAARAMLDRSVSLYEGLRTAGQLAPTMEPDFAEVLGHVGDYHQRIGDVKNACAAFSRAAALLVAAEARAPLTTIRKGMLEFSLKELERCR
jgi:tetratricopeptide (TPR) repeat protein